MGFSHVCTDLLPLTRAAGLFAPSRPLPRSHAGVSPEQARWGILINPAGGAQTGCENGGGSAQAGGTAEEDWKAAHSVSTEKEAPVRIRRWCFKYSFRSMFTSTKRHGEKALKLNCNHNSLIKWVSGPDPGGGYEEVKGWWGKAHIQKEWCLWEEVGEHSTTTRHKSTPVSHYKLVLRSKEKEKQNITKDKLIKF